MSIAKRLYLLMAASLASLLIVTAAGIIQINKVFSAANYGNVNTIPSLIDLNDAMNNSALTRLRVWQFMAVDDAATRDKIIAMMAENDKAVDNAISHYEKENLSDDTDKQLIADIRKTYADFSELRKKTVALAKEGKLDEARDYILANQAIAEKMSAAFKASHDYNVKLGKESADSARSTVGSATSIAVGVSVIAIALILFMGISLIRKIVSSLEYAVDIAETVAKGDLSRNIDVSSNDEVGQLLSSLKTMNSSLATLVSSVRVSTDSINAASTEIATGNMDLSSRTESQASSLEETASSLEELTSTVKQNADNARQANQLASNASETARKGGTVVSEVVETMNEINDSARKIVDIIGVIDGIAFQTNILALNAAVEAARAGEQGRGFAVVAAEVRSLAQRSATAAKEIKVLIDDSVGKVQRGTELVSQAGSMYRMWSVKSLLPVRNRLPVLIRSMLQLPRWTRQRSKMRHWWNRQQRQHPPCRIRRMPCL
ncbi:methyl-accepting chemotaxis protein [Undibacterium squillarum]|uniref:Methyl-accepting chemotaxis protein n=1 Tax=Undibacterium squillarum TaxID=1131567 RepID=A0ABQ2XXR8_9BURK|nr:methyl-accepting chemotaxis protein [Undibacterium squillarum]GGX39530.1 hypothetical protein GCM10010946_17510 [Undibacterium squillarum]